MAPIQPGDDGTTSDECEQDSGSRHVYQDNRFDLPALDSERLLDADDCNEDAWPYNPEQRDVILQDRGILNRDKMLDTLPMTVYQESEMELDEFVIEYVSPRGRAQSSGSRNGSPRAPARANVPSIRNYRYSLSGEYGLHGNNPGLRQLRDPTGIATFGNNQILVTNHRELTLLKQLGHSSGFELQAGIRIKHKPRSVAVNAANQDIYVVTQTHVRKFNSEGVFLMKTRGCKNSTDKREKHFCEATGIDLDPSRKRVFVADWFNAIVHIHDMDSLERVGSIGFQTLQHRAPVQLCVHLGSLYVTDQASASVLVFQGCEDAVSTILGGGGSDETPRFKEPWGVAGNRSTHTVAVADKILQTIFVFDVHNKHALVSQVKRLSFPQALAFLPDGKLAMTEMDTTREQRDKRRADCALLCYSQTFNHGEESEYESESDEESTVQRVGALMPHRASGAAVQGPSASAMQGTSTTAVQGPSSTAVQGPSSTAVQGPSTAAVQGPSAAEGASVSEGPSTTEETSTTGELSSMDDVSPLEDDRNIVAEQPMDQGP